MPSAEARAAASYSAGLRGSAKLGTKPGGRGKDRDLGDRQAEPAGHEQDLDVEGEAVQSGAAEQRERRVAAKALQAALGVAVRQTKQPLDGRLNNRLASRRAGG